MMADDCTEKHHGQDGEVLCKVTKSLLERIISWPGHDGDHDDADGVSLPEQCSRQASEIYQGGRFEGE